MSIHVNAKIAQTVVPDGAGDLGCRVMDSPPEIKQDVDLAVERLGELTDFAFGLDAQSVQWVDGFILRQRERPGFDLDEVGGLVRVLGSFLGECIVVATDGRWARDADTEQWCVRFPSGDRAYPYTKVWKCFEHGAEDSIASFYDISVNYVAKGLLSRRGSSQEQGG
jgi:hypothetical protein